MLFAALGLTLVMIWQSWIEFQQNYAARQDPLSQDSQSAPAGGATNLTEDVPDAPEIAVQTSKQADVAAVIEQPSSSGGQIINVTTDLLNVSIDTHGGDLIRVELMAKGISDATGTAYCEHRTSIAWLARECASIELF